MIANKLIQILQSLNKYELIRCKKFLQSPFFNENNELLLLFELITEKKNKLDFDETNLWNKIYPYTNYNDLKYRRLCSDLSKLIEEFLIQKEFEQHQFEQKIFLLNAINHRNLNSFINTTLTSIESIKQKNQFKNADYYYKEYALEKSNYDRFEFLRTQQTNLNNVLQNLDYFYFIEKLRSYCALLNRIKVISIEYEIQFIDELLNYVKNNLKGKVAAIDIYFTIALLFQNLDEEQHYFELKNLLNLHINLFPADEKRTLFGYAQNYCIGCINKGKTNYLSELFDLYKQVLAKEIIFEAGKKLSPWDYKNIVVIGLRMKEFAWVKNFIEEHKNYLPENFKQNAYTYNMAKYYFYIKKYTKVVELLQEVEYEDLFYSLDSKVMLLKVYYELNEFNTLNSLIDSFKQLLHRKKEITPNHKANYLNLIKYTQKMASLPGKNKKLLSELKTSILNTPHLADINWLLAKIEELGG